METPGGCNYHQIRALTCTNCKLIKKLLPVYILYTEHLRVVYIEWSGYITFNPSVFILAQEKQQTETLQTKNSIIKKTGRECKSTGCLDSSRRAGYLHKMQVMYNLYTISK